MDPAGWNLLQEELAARGTIAIWGHLDLGLATRAAARLMEHDAVSDTRARLRLHTSSGGSSAALTVTDTIAALGVPTEVTAVGAVQGRASGCWPWPGAGWQLATARWPLPPIDCRWRGQWGGLARFLDAEWRDQKRWRDQVAQATGRPPELVEADLGAALVLPSEAALRYRLIDEVVGSPGSWAGSGK